MESIPACKPGHDLAAAAMRPAITLLAIFVCSLTLLPGCSATPGTADEPEPIVVHEAQVEPHEAVAADEPSAIQTLSALAEEATAEDDAAEPEVSLKLARAETPPQLHPAEELPEITIQGQALDRHEEIRNLVSNARTVLRDVELQYVFSGKGKRETLRGRPVAFALWSDSRKEWVIAQIEIPRPPVKWKPGGKPLPITVLTPGITAQHVKGTGAERLMVAFTRAGEKLKVYGRKFPVFDAGLLKKKQWRAVVDTAQPIIYLPFTEDAFDPAFVDGGRDYLLSTARQALDELRNTGAISRAYPGELLADVVPAEVITTLAVIEQTDDADFVDAPAEAVSEVLNHYGLQRGDAFRYSVSRASAIGPMQFTDRRGNGTYSMVVRRCAAANIDPDFERGATNLLNVMKAAICLFDIELTQMRPEIRNAYHDNKTVLGIFPVAAYNGGPKNVTKLYKAIAKMKLQLSELRAPGKQPEDKAVPCPCLWRQTDSGVRPVSIPRYNRENRGYVEKYQNILGVFRQAS